MGNYGLAELSGERRLPLTQSKRKKKKKQTQDYSHIDLSHTHTLIYNQAYRQTNTHAQLYTPQTYTLLSAITDDMPARQPFCRTVLESSIRVIVAYAVILQRSSRHTSKPRCATYLILSKIYKRTP